MLSSLCIRPAACRLLIDAAQETFEDASDMTPRPRLYAGRSRSRSLLSRRESSPSVAQERRTDSPVGGLPANDGAHEVRHNGINGGPKPGEEGAGINGIPKPTEQVASIPGIPKPTEQVASNAQQSKSPQLPAHRLSVTEDMDDVSLDEGTTHSA